jgi:N-acyl-D-amino-acid deacylase
VTSYLLRGGIVFDGVSPRRSPGDLRIVDGRIAELGPDLPDDGSTRIDVEGLWVMPGFVDAHSHADAAVLTGECMEARALAGVTTEIVGQDGLGLSFASGESHRIMADTLGPIAGPLPDREFPDTQSYLDFADRGAFARVATLVPHGTVRAKVMGRQLRDASEDERAAMRRLLSTGMGQGALGLSTGLSYAPALAATTAELIDVTGELPKGTPYVTHLRDYGPGLEESLEEAVEICSRSSLSLHLSHFHLSGPGRAGTAGEFVERLHRAAQGVTWDTYPYTAGCTFIGALLPRSVQSLNAPDLLAHTSDAARATGLAAELDARGPGPTFAAGWDAIYVAGLQGTPLERWDYWSIARIAEDAAISCGRAVLQLFVQAQGRACVLVDQGHPDNIRTLASTDNHLVGSDGILGSGIPHPRATNSFYRFLDWANRDVLDVPVEQMVARMTSRTAARFGLSSGRLAPGLPGDVLVIQPEKLDEGPSMGPYTPSALQHSFIGGVPIVSAGSWQGSKLPGLAARRERSA